MSSSKRLRSGSLSSEYDGEDADDWALRSKGTNLTAQSIV